MFCDMEHYKDEKITNHPVKITRHPVKDKVPSS